VFPPFPIVGFEISDHGNHEMGLASAARNGVGMVGVAYNATLASVLATGKEGYPEPGDWAGEVIDAGVSVMSGSFGPPALPPEDLDFQPILDDELLEELCAVERLSAADVAMVFAAGNEYDEQPTSSQIPSGTAMVPLITPARTTDATLYKILSDGDADDPDTWEYAPMAGVGELDSSKYASTLIAVVAVD